MGHSHKYLNCLYLSAITVFLCSASLFQIEQTKIFVMTRISQIQQSQHLCAQSDYETLSRLIKLITTKPEAVNLNNRLG